MRKLRELRKANNLTIAKAAEELNIPFETYRSYEIGRNQADYDTLIKVAKFFGVSVDYLLGQEEDIRTRLAAPMGDTLTREERELVEGYRGLDDKLKKLVRESIQVYSGEKDLIFKPDKKV